jgi:REP element-mobilizing transposase RayT
MLTNRFEKFQYLGRKMIFPGKRLMFTTNRNFKTFRITLVIVLISACFAVFPVHAAGVIYYVKWNASGANNGTSWANAFTDLQFALSAASSGDEIWVVAGTYYPTPGTDRTISFTLKNGVEIYGGFAGTETLRTQRSPFIITILSGDIGIVNNNRDNSYHVVIGSDTNNTAVLDGFEIRKGYADNIDSEPHFRGGGMYNANGSPTLINLFFSSNFAIYGGGLSNMNSSPTIMHAGFRGNSGNGMYNHASSPILTDVEFRNNTGGLYNYYSNPILTNVTFYNNEGGMYNRYSNPGLTNVTFNWNSSSQGSAIYNSSSNPTLTNVTISENETLGSIPGIPSGSIYNYKSNPIIRNSIVWGNFGEEMVSDTSSTPVVTNSIVEGGYVGTGNLDADPLLDPLTDNGGATPTMALGAGSPAIDAGSDANCPATDQRGLTRPEGSHCDIGAYEYALRTISGSTGVGGATLSYTNGTPQTVTADASGNYSITVPWGWAGTVTPSFATDSFCPASQSYSKLAANKTLQHYAHAACPNFDPISKWTSSFDLSHGWTVSGFVRTVGDVNGDGMDDLVGFGQNGVWVSLSTGSGFPTPTRWVQAFDLAHGWTVQDYVRTVGDVNGDGMDDLVGFGQNGVWVSLSTGSGFPTPTRWVQAFDLAHGWTVQDYVRTVGDVNGDGMDDLVGFGQNGVWVSLSTGSGFPTPTRWVQAFDLAHGWTVQDYVRTVGDVNGDGMDDLVGFGQNGVWVSLSTGSSFPTPSKWTSSFDLSHGWTVQDYVRMVGDVNGDGKADVVGFGQDGVYIGLSTGTTFSLPSRRTTSFDLSHGWTVSQYVRTVGDVNGGGKADLVGFGLNGVYIATAQ